MITRPSIVLALLVILACPSAHAASVTLNPIKDNTLYESDAGNISNGAGPTMFVGRIRHGDTRRALVAFDVAGNVPASATITSVRLTLNVSRTRSATFAIELHRVLADWGEGSSLPFGQGGSGGFAQTGDATWIHRSYDTVLWTNPGGDVSALASAATNVGDLGFYTWGSTPQMVADAQSWLTDPANNFGWLVLGDESTFPTAKAFDTRENATPANRPTLVIEYDVLTPVRSDTWGYIKALYR